MTERRTPSVRRDMNDLIRDPSGKVAEAKVFAVAGKFALIYVFLHHAETILKDWTLLSVVVVALIAPDLLKKMVSMRLAAKDSKK